jgi:hypothetical protein
MRRHPFRRTTRRVLRPSRLLIAVLLGAVLTVAALVAAGAASAGVAGPIPGPPLPTPSGALPHPSGWPTNGPASPAPSTTATPTPSPSDSSGGGSGDNPGLFDIPGQIRKAINDFISEVAQTGLTPVLDTLGTTVLSTPDLTANPQVQVLWTTSLVIANAIFVLFVVAGGFIIAARDTLQTRYGLKEIAPRIAVAGVAANASLLICGKVIQLTNAVTAAIAGQGVDGQSAASALRQMLQLKGNSLPPTLFSLLIWAALVMAIVVVIMFVLRAAFLVLLIGIAPLGLMCHATPQTEELAYTWWRALAACAGIQLGQAMLILATVRVFLTPAGTEVFGVPSTSGGLLGLLVCLTMLWLLIKLPGWMRYLILGRLGRQRGLFGEILHAYLQLKLIGALVGMRGGTSRSPRGTGTGTKRTGTGTKETGGTGTGTISGPKPSPTKPGSGTNPPGGTGRGRTRSPRSRPFPAPAGPAAFSHTPATQTPLSAPGGTTGAPAFSNTAPPFPPRSRPQGPAPAAGFSHPPATQAASPQLTTNPGAARFSNAPAQATPRRATGPAPAPGFTGAPRPQAAPRRPPTPATPVFSSPSPSPSRASFPFPSRASSRSPSPAVTPSPSPFPTRTASSPSPFPSRASSPSPSPAVPPSPSRRSHSSRSRSRGGDQ